MTVGAALQDEWDFYPCRVEDAAASIALNLWFERVAPLPSADTLYWVDFHMRDVGPHGMGTAAEAEVLDPIADQIVAHAEKLGLLYVGRLRGSGRWSLFLYGPPEQLESLRALARDGEALDNRQVDAGSQHDATWAHYREFLLPSDERRQWMKNRRTVEVLEQHGDPLVEPRLIDHWAYFRTAEGRQVFVSEAAREGFSIDAPFDASGSARPYGARVHRVDRVDLEAIHEVVMKLIGLAQQAGGGYDGWESVVLKPEPN
jgi:hypothetical protein